MQPDDCIASTSLSRVESSRCSASVDSTLMRMSIPECASFIFTVTAPSAAGSSSMVRIFGATLCRCASPTFAAGAAVTVAEGAKEAEAIRLRACGASNSAKAVGNCVAGARIASVPIGSGAAAPAPSSTRAALCAAETFGVSSVSAGAFADVGALGSNAADLMFADGAGRSTVAASGRRSEFLWPLDEAPSAPRESAFDVGTTKESKDSATVDALTLRSLAAMRSLDRKAVMRSRCGGDAVDAAPLTMAAED